MGHKTHPLGFRLGITQQHRSAWYSKLSNYSTLIKEDFAIRKIIYDYFIYNSIKSTGITKILPPISTAAIPGLRTIRVIPGIQLMK